MFTDRVAVEDRCPNRKPCAVLAAGGRDNGRPGPREGVGAGRSDYYGAFVLDPDGNNIEACMREPAARGAEADRS